MKTLRIAIAGASGFVGRYLIEALLKEGYSVLALSRAYKENKTNSKLLWKKCDLFSRKDTREALKNCDIAIYLTHSMIPSSRLSQGNFEDYDLVLADNFARSAKENKVKGLVYLGGIIPEDPNLSRHLSSRLEVERTLAASQVPLTTLRAGIILGPEGSSFRIMYNLVKYLPMMVCPSWTRTLSNPISIWDVISALKLCIQKASSHSKTFDIGGKTTLSYFEMMRILAEKLQRKRVLLTAPFFSPNLSKLWVATVTGAPKNLVYPLIGSLKTHMVPNIHRRLPIKTSTLMTYEESIDRILAEESKLNSIPQAFQSSAVSKDKTVRSIQRLETLYRFNAQEVSDLYFSWLDKSIPLLKVEKTNRHIHIKLWGIHKPLISLNKKMDLSSKDYCLFYIQEGLLSHGKGRGRLIFRTIVDGRNTMVEIHEFRPKLPWFIYKYTQAVVHVFTMKLFKKHLLNLQRNADLDFTL